MVEKTVNQHLRARIRGLGDDKTLGIDETIEDRIEEELNDPNLRLNLQELVNRWFKRKGRKERFQATREGD